MSIAIVCGACGKRGEVADAAARKTARCRSCGASMDTPAAPAPMKVCTACGTDVSGKKRTKDTQGRYYCQPCWQAKVSAGAARSLSPARAAVVAAPGQVPSAARTPLAAIPIGPGTIGKPVQPAEVEDLEILEECGECGISSPISELVPDGEGQLVCTSCARKEVPLAPPPLPTATTQTYVAPPYAVPSYLAPTHAAVLPYRSPPRRRARVAASGSYDRMMLVGGLLCLVGVVVTVGSFVTAVSGGGGTYIVAWGAILFGGIRFIRGLAGKMTGG